ncbi:hypothetical protein ACFVQ9_37485 [Streptomyces goshikiensis]|uniref:hypothetical protein n=1 Tax=Streptomyces goshikiensis TaxID=1942 RepID=UPI001F03A67D
MSFPRFTLVPGPIDVDVPGWELTGDRTTGEHVIECHELFHPHDENADIEAALTWADGIIGTRQVWTHVRERGFDRWEAGAEEELPSGKTPEYERWTSLTIRRPDDVPAATPLAWHVEKLTEHNDRLMNNALPADFKYDVQRGDAGDALAAIALRESIHRQVEQQRGSRVREAIDLGATWSEVAAALDVTPDDARTLLREWANGQHHLYRGDLERAMDNPLGLSPERHAAVLALTELGDDEGGRRG